MRNLGLFSVFLVLLTTSVGILPNQNVLPVDTKTNIDLDNGKSLEPIQFAVIGDYGLSGLGETDVASLVKGWNPDFILTVGDNNYYLGASETIDENIGQYYHEFIYPYSGVYGTGAKENRFFPALGNHDWYTQNAQPYLDYFSLLGNERYYDFVKGPVHFFVLDSDANEPDGISSTSTQALWLQSNLASSISIWNVVLLHHAPYSSGGHGSSTALQWPFKSWGADVVIAGHDHIYERLFIDGLPYFVNGLGGGPIANFGTLLAGNVTRYNGDFGAMRVTASEEIMNFQFITRTGLVVDSYSLGLPSTVLVNSTLPTSRTVVSGTKATVFSTILNAGTETARDVILSMEPKPNGLFTYRQTDCQSNAVISGQNPLLDVPPGGKLCYVLSFTPNQPFDATNVHIRAHAANSQASLLFNGVNTWVIRSTAVSGPDIIALTTTADLHQISCLGATAFAVALSNVGADAVGDITVLAHTGTTYLPVHLSVFETEPASGMVIGDNKLEGISAGENRTVGVFLTINDCINFNPVDNRIFIELRDAENKVVGSTSTSISTNR